MSNNHSVYKVVSDHSTYLVFATSEEKAIEALCQLEVDWKLNNPDVTTTIIPPDQWVTDEFHKELSSITTWKDLSPDHAEVILSTEY